MLTDQNDKQVRIKPRVLWVDDLIPRYSTYVRELRKWFIVNTCESVDQAEIRLAEREYDIVLLDLLMPERTGFELLPTLFQEGRNEKVCFLSSYLDLAEFRDRINQIEQKVYVLDKEIPPIDGGLFYELFVQKIDKFIAEPPKFTPKQFLNSVRSLLKDDPINISYKQYASLPYSIQEEINENADSQLIEDVNSQFDIGYIWVLYCGSDKPEKSATVASDIWSEDEILDFAVSRDRVPFVYHRPSRAEDYDRSEACEGHEELLSYPTVTIQPIVGNPAKAKFHAHFDTGSRYSWVDGQFWRRLTGDADLEVLRTTWINGIKVRFKLKSQTGLFIVDQLSSNKKSIKLDLRVVANWGTSPLRRPCPTDCRLHGEQIIAGSKFCRNRSALLGRDILWEGQTSIYLDADNRCTRLTSAAVKRE